MSQTNVPPEISGTAQDAQNWISASDLPEEKKHALLSFTKQFPTLTFFKQERPATDPQWLRSLGEALLGFVPDDLCWFRFVSFRYSPDRDSLANSARVEASWYHRLVFDAALGEYDHIFLGDEPVVFVACVLEDLSSLLAVKVGTDGDESIYEFAYSSVDDIGSRQGRVDPSRATRVFDSYPDMLNHFGAIKLGNGEILEVEPAGITYVINSDDCINCGACAEECPVSCISESDGVHVIDASACTGCGECAEICPTRAPQQKID